MKLPCAMPVSERNGPGLSRPPKFEPKPPGSPIQAGRRFEVPQFVPVNVLTVGGWCLTAHRISSSEWLAPNSFHKSACNGGRCGALMAGTRKERRGSIAGYTSARLGATAASNVAFREAKGDDINPNSILISTELVYGAEYAVRP